MDHAGDFGGFWVQFPGSARFDKFGFDRARVNHRFQFHAGGGGESHLDIGPLKRVNGVYTGNYAVKLFPYFFKNEKGTLAIVVSDESLAMINLGKEAKVSGTATTSGKHGVSRTLTPPPPRETWIAAGSSCGLRRERG